MLLLIAPVERLDETACREKPSLQLHTVITWFKTCYHSLHV